MADSTIPPPPPPSSPAVVGKKPAKTKHVFMLHEPGTLKSLAKLSSSDFRYAALKVASRGSKLPESTRLPNGNTKIWLRKTNTKTLREYEGNVITLETPQEVVRQGRTIVYKKKPTVKFVKSWTWGDPSAAAAAAATQADVDDVPDLN